LGVIPPNRQELSPPLPPAAEGFTPRPQFRLNGYRTYKTLLPLKLLVDADDWPFLTKRNAYMHICCVFITLAA